MEKQKPWQLWLIVCVILLTLYNILPTVFFYTKPLSSPIDESRAQGIEREIVSRVNALEGESIEWLHSFNKLLGLSPDSIAIAKGDPRVIEVTFQKPEDAKKFRIYLPRAGALIPFGPEQLRLLAGANTSSDKTVLVERNMGFRLNEDDLNRLFTFSTLWSEDGKISPFYQEVVSDRAMELGLGLTSASPRAKQVEVIVNAPLSQKVDDQAVALAREIIEAQKTLGKYPTLLKRYWASFSEIDVKDREDFITRFVARLDSLKTSIETQAKAINDEEKKLKEKGALQDASKSQALAILNNEFVAIESAMGIIKKNLSDFSAGLKPLSQAEIKALWAKSFKQMNEKEKLQLFDISGYHPLVKALLIDWKGNSITFVLYDDVQKVRLSEDTTETIALAQEKLNQLIIGELARVGRLNNENIQLQGDNYGINLSHLTDAQSFLALNLGTIADISQNQWKNQLLTNWTPKYADLVRENYPIRDYNAFKKETGPSRNLGLVIYAPAAIPASENLEGFRKNSIYIIARGLDAILQKQQEIANPQESKVLSDDFRALQQILEQSGFIAYPGASFGLGSEFERDYIFELNNYFGNLLMATREDFYVKGSERYAILDFTNVEQRILARNRIDDKIHEDLLKWRDEYNAAQVDLSPASRYFVPKPTTNVYLDNFILSAKKYFRGDDRKILKWGLDLSGGKTVRIGLRDKNNRPVTDTQDLNQAVNELYVRINAMGVSERTIRVENESIILDFPGSQGLSATELVKASAMYFHIVNEKFSPMNQEISSVVNRFLQNVWNEAVVTNRKDVESINEIAWRQMGGTSSDDMLRPRSESAETLYQNGLKLANPRKDIASGAFNDTLSSIAVLRGEDISDWHGETHPLMVVFHNYALEGSNLESVQVGYDPKEGNMLMFSVKSSAGSKDKGYTSPRDDFYAWTSHFAQDKVVGTPLEAYSRGRGWQMAIILNGQVISSPVLRQPLRDNGTISGRFTQREINQLAADLKAGSLSFTPIILSEENVSPELGATERSKGIFAASLAIILVVLAMVGYYHFAGVVAAVAVLFNILVMWGVFQNIDAVITLPGIAALVLTVGMAVDANVLVFERIREEFAISGRIASAIQAGYRKAFSAIFDSNITTIMAAFILLQFDSGPIKGFALMLIIGILSSMFTSLFMTRFYFAGWVKNPNHKSLSMSRFFETTHFDFLRQTKKAVIASLIVMAIGIAFIVSQRHTILGMDFTGGYSLTVNLEETPTDNYRSLAMESLLSSGAASNDFQIRELSRPNQLRIQLGTSMEEKGHPFYQMGEKLTLKHPTYPYEENPRIAWVVNSLAKQNLHVQKSQLPGLERDWSQMSGQLSDAMRNNALIALGLALLGILIYITLRFEFKFAIGAVIGLAHDILITVGIAALFNKMGFPVQIDLQVVGALMTILGYSLNDTIIVFDRIREDMHIYRKMKFDEIINLALNVTLGRTVMTAGTTLLVLLALVLFGGSSIFGFSLVMFIGILVGTFSSLFIAAPVLLYFHNREVAASTKEVSRV